MKKHLLSLLFLLATSTAWAVWPSSGGGGGGSIGSTVSGGTVGSVLFVGTGGALTQDNANFFWDDTNNRLGIGTTTPASTLDVAGNVNSTGTYTSSNGSSSIIGSNSVLSLGAGGTALGAQIYTTSASLVAQSTFSALTNGLVGIGISNPTQRLVVGGITAGGTNTTNSVIVTSSSTLVSVQLTAGDVAGGLGLIGMTSNNGMQIVTNNTSRITVAAAGNVTVPTSFVIGNSTSAAILRHMSYAASLDFGATAAGTCDGITIAANGAADGDTVYLGVPTALAGADVYQSFWAYVSAASVVTVKRCNLLNLTTALSNPAAATVRVDIWQH